MTELSLQMDLTPEVHAFFDPARAPKTFYRLAYSSTPPARIPEGIARLARAIRQAPRSQQLALLRVHPELAGSEATAGTMTADSNSEQDRLGLLSLHPDDLARLTDLNRRYRERFGFPYVAAMRLHGSLADVFRSFEQRLHNDPATGVMRHADAGYQIAIDCAKEQGLNLPMITGK